MSLSVFSHLDVVPVY